VKTNKPTIRMPKATLTKWLTALRSGEYRQGYNTLRDENGGYCCLGVLQHCLTGEVESDCGGRAFGVPTKVWLDKHRVYFLEHPASSVANPYLPPLSTSAAEANDDGKSFLEIADAIEASTETY
jgi:hypothetical protein